MRPIVTIRGALGDRDLLGGIMRGSSRLAWRAVLIAAMGEQLTVDERDVFRQLTERASEPLTPIEELFAIVGRRGGKSSAIAALVVYLGALCTHENLAIGERGVCLVLAQNAKQASIVFNYVAGILESVPTLAALVTNKTTEVISLNNRIDIEIRAASFRGVRGITAIAVIVDELAYFFSDETSRNPDSEILAAVRPALATTRGPLIAIGSPYARRGEMWRAFRRDYGANGDPRILVVKGASRELNPTLPQSVIDRALERDEASARAEYLAEFRSDIESFVSQEAVDAAMFLGRLELPPISGLEYVAFVDPSGGSANSMTLAIAHAEDAKDGGDPIAVLDAIREVRPRFSPDFVVGEFVDLLGKYGLSEVTGDRYGGEFVRERFESRGVTYAPSERPKSDIYRELLPLLNSRRVELLDLAKLQSQLIGLERRTARGGRDSIDHAPGAHDDVANAAAGALVLAAGVGSNRFNSREFIQAWGGGEMNRFARRLRGQW